MKSRYSLNKSLRVGDRCICPSCGTEFIKVNYQQAFCKTKAGTFCKDGYWNKVTPNKRNNQTRISPASRLWLEELEERQMFSCDEHPFSSDGHGQK